MSKNNKPIKAARQSLRKLYTLLAFILIPIFILGVFTSIYSLMGDQRSVKENMLSSIDVLVERAEDSLLRMNYFLVETLLHNNSIQEIEAARRDLDRNIASRSFLDDLSFEARFWAANYSFCFCSDNLPYTVSRFNDSINPEANRTIRKLVADIAASDEVPTSTLTWSHMIIDNSLYLYKVYADGGNYISSWISCDTLLTDLRIGMLSPEGSITYLDEEHIPLPVSGVVKTAPVSEQALDLGLISEIHSLARTDISVFIEDKLYLDAGNLIFLFAFMSFVLILLVGVSIFTIRYYKRNIEIPLENFRSHINEYALAKQNAKDTGFTELNEAVAVFDSITEQIEELKIDVYEEKLSIVKAELQYYHLQIKPHFFVNCFSIIHAMAQKKDFARIQEFCIKLSNYVRFLLVDSLDLIPLKDELLMMHEYLDIQKIRHKTNSILHGEIDPELDYIKIPPLVILTFVENSIKYGAGDTGKDITIEVKVSEIYLDGERKLYIIISDDGIGFPEEILEYNNLFDNTLEDSGGSRHIGIRNIHTRLYLLYGKTYSLKFRNVKDANGNVIGCRVEIILPVKNG